MSGKKVLIVDDTIINLMIGVNALKNDFIVSTVPSGEKLLSSVSSITPDLILLDIEMPEMNGFEAFERLKRDAQTASIPVIFLTSSDSIEYEKRAFALGAIDFMHKPYYGPYLSKRIAAHLKALELEQQQHEFEEKLQDTQKIMGDLRSKLLNTVIDLVERREEVSGGHVERTRKYVEVLLDVLVKNKIYDEIIASWKKSLLLHSTMLYDVGKILIHDSILLKPDKLEEDEFSAIKKHTQIGVNIIDSILADMPKDTNEAGFLEYARDFAGYHHEKWDGTGYPGGLSGYNIPLPGRLIAIADVYDALITKRAYKKTYTPEEAVEIICQGKGTQFDPLLVDVFLSASDKFRTIAENSIAQ